MTLKYQELHYDSFFCGLASANLSGRPLIISRKIEDSQNIYYDVTNLFPDILIFVKLPWDWAIYTDSKDPLTNKLVKLVLLFDRPINHNR